MHQIGKRVPSIPGNLFQDDDALGNSQTCADEEEPVKSGTSGEQVLQPPTSPSKQKRSSPKKGQAGEANGAACPGFICRICKTNPKKAKSAHCTLCTKEVAAARKDAEKNGWLGVFTERSKREDTFQALMLEYKAQFTT